MFFDRRLPRGGDETLFRRLEPLGEKAFELAFVPDAGIWEYRERKRHPYPFGRDVLGRLPAASRRSRRISAWRIAPPIGASAPRKSTPR